MNRTIYNHVFKEKLDSKGVVHRIVVKDMYSEQLEYIKRESKRLKRIPSMKELRLIGIYKPSISHESHEVTLVKLYKHTDGTFYFEFHFLNRKNQPDTRFRKWLQDIVPTI